MSLNFSCSSPQKKRKDKKKKTKNKLWCIIYRKKNHLQKIIQHFTSLEKIRREGSRRIFSINQCLKDDVITKLSD